MTRQAQVIADVLSQTIAAERLDEHLWAHIVTRVFGEKEAVLAWLREDELRLVGGLDASLCLARTILPGWRIRLETGHGQLPKACCDRPDYRLGHVEAADESLAVCAALLGAMLAIAEKNTCREPSVARAPLWRLIASAAFTPAAWATTWFRTPAMSSDGRHAAK